jgi:virginiamycin B lyase
MFAPPGEPALRAWAMDDSGRLWLTTRNPGGIARFDPADPAGTWRHFTGPAFDAPDGNTLGPDGAIWLVDTGRNALLRVEPESGTVESHRSPGIAAPFDLKPGPGGSLWFTNRGAPTLGRLEFVAGP